MKISCVCCGTEVDKPTPEVVRSNKIGRPMYCSRTCSVKQQQINLRKCNIELYNKSPKKCIRCGAVIPYDARKNSYCSKSCSAKANNQLLRKDPPKCHLCGNNCKRGCVYCSQKCCLEHNKQKIVAKINNGEKVGVVRIRKYLIEVRGARCELCGWEKINPSTKKCPIDLDHIDGNHQNNLLSNLRLICPNCHSLTPTYKALNVGRGRKSRKRQ